MKGMTSTIVMLAVALSLAVVVWRTLRNAAQLDEQIARCELIEAEAARCAQHVQALAQGCNAPQEGQP